MTFIATRDLTIKIRFPISSETLSSRVRSSLIPYNYPVPLIPTYSILLLFNFREAI